MNGFDAAPHFGRIRAPVLYVLSRTDRLFPPALAAPVTMCTLASVFLWRNQKGSGFFCPPVPHEGALTTTHLRKPDLMTAF